MSEHERFTIEREVPIRAPRSLVFRYFSDSPRFAAWWGVGSTIEGRIGGAVRIVNPGGIIAVGEVVEFAPEERIAFTFGFESGSPIPVGGSVVTVTLTEEAAGTLLRLRHEVADEKTRGQFVQGWRYQLSLFANVAAAEAHAEIEPLIDRWFAAWNEGDAARRAVALGECATPDLTFADAFSCTHGIEDLNAHVTAAKFHMPGITLVREGTPMQCQGSAVVGWIARGKEGATIGTGSNFFLLAPDGRIQRVVGFWKGR